MNEKIPKRIISYINKMTTAERVEHTRDLLVKMIEVDTTPHSDPSTTREREREVFDIITAEIQDIYGKRRKPEFLPIDLKIAEHPHYTPPHYTKTAENPAGLTVEETFKGRGNLVFTLKGNKGPGMNLAMNAHVDTVAPHFGPSVEGDIVRGRGACDDKGQVALMLAQMRMLKEVTDKFGLKLNKGLHYQFVIEEEPGGNGSLSLAIQDPFPFDVLVVHEITELRLHPANRGAVWYKIELDTLGDPMVNLLEMAACVVLALEKEGGKIKAESDHPLFPTRPVQTSHGILGPFGEHPSAVNDLIVFNVSEGPDKKVLNDVIRSAVKAYCELYGDKTKVKDEATGKPVVARHYTLSEGDGGFEVAVHGKAGHMGALLECDNAITKAAYIIRALTDYRRREDAEFTVSLKGDPGGRLILEGGQGFLPTHEMSEVMARLRNAAQNGAGAYCAMVGVPFKEEMVSTTFDKLHNDAFERSPDTPAMQAAIYACKEAGIWRDEPIIGWNVSCDSRIFAKQFPTREVITFGVGSLSSAHSADESVSMEEIMAAARMMTIYALAVCGCKEK